jgi:heme exporter protein B
MIGQVFRRELLLAWRRPGDTLLPLAFFVIVGSLFPLGVGAEPALLHAIGPGVVWIAAVLATLLGLPRLFAADQHSGALEQLLLSPTPLALLVGAKITAQWLTCGLPLALAAPVLALAFGLNFADLAVLLAGLLLGTPLLYLLGAISAALTLGLRGGGALLGLLVLPLYVPVLIFGAGAVQAAALGFGAGANLSLLAAMLVLAAVFAPWAAAAALRISLD